jgi:hypothetical protein
MNFHIIGRLSSLKIPVQNINPIKGEEEKEGKLSLAPTMSTTDVGTKKDYNIL